MKFVVQRVSEAEVRIEGQTVGKIGKGLLVLIGCEIGDDRKVADRYLSKLLKLRIFEDEEGKTNRALADINGELLLVSQFTLMADVRKGNRPSFLKAGDPKLAEELYDYIVEEAKKQVPVVETGRFGAEMKVHLVNDGPFTLLLENLT